MPLDLAVLGPLVLRDSDRVLTPGGPVARGLLAYLALHPNEPVAARTLLGRLWGAAPPTHSRKQLRCAVDQLRAVVRAHEADGWSWQEDQSGSCFVLGVPEDASDLLIVRRQAAKTRSWIQRGRFDLAAQAARAALRLWTGPPLADVAMAAKWPELARLHEERCQVVEDRLRADLVCGESGLVEDAYKLVQEEPDREPARAVLMAALRLAGRPDEARRVYVEAAARLGEEWGLDPGSELIDERRLLEGSAPDGAEPPAADVTFLVTEVSAEMPPSAEVRARIRAAVEVGGGVIVWEVDRHVVAAFHGRHHAFAAVAAGLSVSAAPAADQALRTAVVRGRAAAAVVGKGGPTRTGPLLGQDEVRTCRTLLDACDDGRPVVDPATCAATSASVSYQTCASLVLHKAVRMWSGEPARCVVRNRELTG